MEEDDIKLEPPSEYFDGEPTSLCYEVTEILENDYQMPGDSDDEPHSDDEDDDTDLTVTTVPGSAHTSSLRTVIKLTLPPNSITSGDDAMENGRGSKVFTKHVKAGTNIYTIKLLLTCSRDPTYRYQKNLKTEHIRPKRLSYEEQGSEKKNMNEIVPENAATDDFHFGESASPETGTTVENVPETEFPHSSNMDGSLPNETSVGDSDFVTEPSLPENVEVPGLTIEEDIDSDGSISSDHFLELLQDMTTEELVAYNETSSSMNTDEMDTSGVPEVNTRQGESLQGDASLQETISSDFVSPKLEIVNELMEERNDTGKTSKIRTIGITKEQSTQTQEEMLTEKICSVNSQNNTLTLVPIGNADSNLQLGIEPKTFPMKEIVPVKAMCSRNPQNEAVTYPGKGNAESYLDSGTEPEISPMKETVPIQEVCSRNLQNGTATYPKKDNAETYSEPETSPKKEQMPAKTTHRLNRLFSDRVGLFPELHTKPGTSRVKERILPRRKRKMQYHNNMTDMADGAAHSSPEMDADAVQANEQIPSKRSSQTEPDCTVPQTTEEKTYSCPEQGTNAEILQIKEKLPIRRHGQNDPPNNLGNIGACCSMEQGTLVGCFGNTCPSLELATIPINSLAEKQTPAETRIRRKQTYPKKANAESYSDPGAEPETSPKKEQMPAKATYRWNRLFSDRVGLHPELHTKPGTSRVKERILARRKRKIQYQNTVTDIADGAAHSSPEMDADAVQANEQISSKRSGQTKPDCTVPQTTEEKTYSSPEQGTNAESFQIKEKLPIRRHGQNDPPNNLVKPTTHGNIGACSSMEQGTLVGCFGNTCPSQKLATIPINSLAEKQTPAETRIRRKLVTEIKKDQRERRQNRLGERRSIEYAETRLKNGISHFCVFCAEKFSSKQELIKHNKNHTLQDGFQCHYCGEKYNTLYLLKAHETMHYMGEQHECGVCGKVFHKPNSLHLHLKYHRRKDSECRKSPKSFSRKSHLTP